tara:strand:+ start:5510 stop:6190 length:681 start_codon:yes stop_codon:yes gene_type:complete
MDCILLAGGFGTRLGKLTKNLPKPMLKVNKLPFIEILVKKICKSKKIKKIIISTHYKTEIIEKYFKFKPYPVKILKEKVPLGTGGAIKNCIKICKSKKVLILNGDTFVNINFSNYIKKNINKKKNIMLLVKKKDNSRYGTIIIKKEKIYFSKFGKNVKSNKINAGVYIVNKSIFKSFKKVKFSFENFLAKKINHKDWDFKISNSLFLDIGVKKDYFYAKKKLKKFE